MKKELKRELLSDVTFFSKKGLLSYVNWDLTNYPQHNIILKTSPHKGLEFTGEGVGDCDFASPYKAEKRFMP